MTIDWVKRRVMLAHTEPRASWKPVVALVVGGGVHLAGRLIAHQRAFSLATEDDGGIFLNLVDVYGIAVDAVDEGVEFCG